MRNSLLILPLLMLTGCWFGSGDSKSLPVAIEEMESSSASRRERAQQRASDLVGGGVNFRPHDDPQQREAEIQRYRRLHQLAQEHDERYFVDLVPVLLAQMDDEEPEVRRLAGEDVVQLTNVSYGYDADAPRDERLAVIERYRQQWQQWNAPDSRVLEFKRHPDKLQEFKRQRIEELKRRAQAND